MCNNVKIIIGLLVAQALWMSLIDFQLIKIIKILKDWTKEQKDH